LFTSNIRGKEIKSREREREREREKKSRAEHKEQIRRAD
jgi:hypothetical protein